MQRRRLPPEVEEQVRQRAGSLCEYCHTSEEWQYVRFTVDHVLPVALGGGDDLGNLALACFHCNRKKSNRRTAVEPGTREVVPFFNPRRHRWGEHFIWSASGLVLVGQTVIGRASVDVLDLNRERVIHIRGADLIVGRHPPLGDPRQHE